MVYCPIEFAVTKARQQTGAAGEQIACNFLQEQEYRIIERNHRSGLVELDIIAAYGEFPIYCEVKTRRGSSGPHPSLSVTAKKIGKLRQLGELYLSLKHLTYLQPHFDVIAVQLVDGKPPNIDHFINAF